MGLQAVPLLCRPRGSPTSPRSTGSAARDPKSTATSTAATPAYQHHLKILQSLFGFVVRRRTGGIPEQPRLRRARGRVGDSRGDPAFPAASKAAQPYPTGIRSATPPAHQQTPNTCSTSPLRPRGCSVHGTQLGPASQPVSGTLRAPGQQARSPPAISSRTLTWGVQRMLLSGPRATLRPRPPTCSQGV